MSTTPLTLTHQDWQEGEDDHIEAIQGLNGATREQAARLIDAMAPLYDLLGEWGWTDAYPGAETLRTSAEAVAFIHHRSNCSQRDCVLCLAWDGFEAHVRRSGDEVATADTDK